MKWKRRQKRKNNQLNLNHIKDLALKTPTTWPTLTKSMSENHSLPENKSSNIAKRRASVFFLIGTMDEVSDLQTLSSALAHELAHAFYYVDTDYRNTMNQLTAPILQRMQVVLYLNGYHPSVIRDEALAYLVDGLELLGLEEDYSGIQRLVKSVFNVQINFRTQLF
jgi:hypothetical protein